ncbi:MAG: hypothetical protein E6I38_03255 [Chloroflexi bacterium]|nr:MAG: hypothetical protein E6I38_03255 [Chloroflexota bacterium]
MPHGCRSLLALPPGRQ